MPRRRLRRVEAEGEGSFHADEEARYLEWGAEFSHDYSGWLTVEKSAEGEFVAKNLILISAGIVIASTIHGRGM